MCREMFVCGRTETFNLQQVQYRRAPATGCSYKWQFKLKRLDLELQLSVSESKPGSKWIGACDPAMEPKHQGLTQYSKVSTDLWSLLK